MDQRMRSFGLLNTSMTRRRFAGASALAAASLGLARVPAISAAGVEITWSSWGNTGEVAHLKEFNDAYNKTQSAIQAKYIPVPTDGYEAKLLTQLNGGTAPDVFYSGDGTIATLIKNKAVKDLTETLAGAHSKSKPDEFAGDLWGPAKSAEGTIYGVPVDCNPLVLWFNKKLLQNAGITDSPADLHDAGKWTWEAFQGMLDKLAAKGSKPFVLSDWWALRYSWVTGNGGKIYDGGKYVANDDPKSMEAFQWLADNIKAKKIIFSGSLPKGQGDDAMFMSGQLGFSSFGRWTLPIFRENKNLDCDIVPYPTNTGKKIEPAGVAVAYWVINQATKHPDEAFEFYTYYVSPEGQKGRLSTGGNAVPSIKGVEDVVLSDPLPEHKQYFIDARNVGYGPLREEAGTPGLSNALDKMYAKLWLDGGDVKTAIQEIATKANSAIAAGGV